MEKPSFAPAFLRELAEYNPIGMKLSEQDVQDWFDFVWLRFSTYDYRGRGVKRAVISWWSRVREGEIEEARERSARILEEADLERLTVLRDQPSEGAVVVDFASLILGDKASGLIDVDHRPTPKKGPARGRIHADSATRRNQQSGPRPL